MAPSDLLIDERALRTSGVRGLVTWAPGGAHLVYDAGAARAAPTHASHDTVGDGLGPDCLVGITERDYLSPGDAGPGVDLGVAHPADLAFLCMSSDMQVN